ncbi:Uma2 family endonuclease [Streptomyces sp. NPDC058665]|uniref:Uma2 family endonuclease n=1 Tax=Streptomyces sp. NPDC058665 TaxID=3346586 RepID=UPI003661159F
MSTSSTRQMTGRPGSGSPETLLGVADRLMDLHPGYRVEIVGGSIRIAPLPDPGHARTLSDLMLAFTAVELHGDTSEVLQAIGLWLPTGPEDFAIPDLSVVDSGLEDHRVQFNCYAPTAFRLVTEVTYLNFQQDLRDKVTAYAEAKIPVYVIVDRKHNRLHVLTDAVGADYVNHRIHAPGEQIVLPESIGAEVKLDVSAVLRAGERKRTTS